MATVSPEALVAQRIPEQVFAWSGATIGGMGQRRSLPYLLLIALVSIRCTAQRDSRPATGRLIECTGTLARTPCKNRLDFSTRKGAVEKIDLINQAIPEIRNVAITIL